MMLTSLLVLSSLVAFVLLSRSLTAQHGKKLPPGPPGLPIIGNLLQLLGAEQRWLTFMSWTQKYGPLFFLNVGGKPAIVIGSHKVAIDLLEKRGGIYSGRPRNIVSNEIMTGGFVFGFKQYDGSWRRMRKASHEVLSHQVAKKYHKFQSQEAALLVKDLFKTPEVYIRHIHRATTSSLLSVLYGLPPCPDPFAPTLVLINELTEIVLDAAAPGKYLVENFPFLRYLPSRLCSWKRHAEEVFVSTNKIFQGLYDEVEKRMETGEIIPSVTTSLIQDPIHKDLTPQERAWVAGTLYAAGSETTAKQMLWFILSMATHPDVQAKAQMQIDNVVGRERMPSFDDFENLPYVQALIRELLRWRGVAPFGVPHALSEDDIYEGYFISKGTDCIVNVWGLNHDQNVYGSDTKLFRPERHLDERGQIRSIASRETKDEGHCSFGFGRRVCVGRYIAVNNLFIQIACILWCFNITPAEDETGKPILIDENQMLDDGLTTRPLPTNRYKFIPRFVEMEEIIKNDLESNGFSYA